MGHLGTFSYSQPSSSTGSLDYGPDGEFGFGAYREFEDPGEATSARAKKPGAGIPCRCVCGLTPITQTSTTEKNPGRVFYGCKNSKSGRGHLFKWLDEALMDEIVEIRTATQKQGECIRQMEDWYNYQEAPTIKALENEISELKALVIHNHHETANSMNKVERKYLLVACLVVIGVVLYFVR